MLKNNGNNRNIGILNIFISLLSSVFILLIIPPKFTQAEKVNNISASVQKKFLEENDSLAREESLKKGQDEDTLTTMKLEENYFLEKGFPIDLNKEKKQYEKAEDESPTGFTFPCRFLITERWVSPNLRVNTNLGANVTQRFGPIVRVKIKPIIREVPTPPIRGPFGIGNINDSGSLNKYFQNDSGSLNKYFQNDSGSLNKYFQNDEGVYKNKERSNMNGLSNEGEIEGEGEGEGEGEIKPKKSFIPINTKEGEGEDNRPLQSVSSHVPIDTNEGEGEDEGNKFNEDEGEDEEVIYILNLLDYRR